MKTSVAKELAPYDEDWYYTRCASVARHIYVRSPVSVKTITKIYGVQCNKVNMYTKAVEKLNLL